MSYSKDYARIIALLTPGTLIQHFKRELLSESELETNSDRYLYKVIGEAVDCNDECKHRVVYESLEDGSLYVRDVDEYLSEVDKIKYPDIKQHYRFELYSY